MQDRLTAIGISGRFWNGTDLTDLASMNLEGPRFLDLDLFFKNDTDDELSMMESRIKDMFKDRSESLAVTFRAGSKVHRKFATGG